MKWQQLEKLTIIRANQPADRKQLLSVPAGPPARGANDDLVEATVAGLVERVPWLLVEVPPLAGTQSSNLTEPKATGMEIS